MPLRSVEDKLGLCFKQVFEIENYSDAWMPRGRALKLKGTAWGKRYGGEEGKKSFAELILEPVEQSAQNGA